MLSTALRRSLARHSAFSNRRLYSSPSESTQKKAQDTLTSAQKNASKLWESSKKYLDPLTEKAGQMLGCTSFLTSPHFPLLSFDFDLLMKDANSV
jgi:F-type H+-transporting ATPase subunit g